MLNILKLVCVLLILEQFFFTEAVKFQPTQECVSKYGVLKRRAPLHDDVLGLKMLCAQYCTFPSDTNTPGNMDETQMAIMCSQVEDTEANNERLQTCLNKYNTTLNYYYRVPFSKTKYFCVLNCFVPGMDWPRSKGMSSADFAALCSTVEEKPENIENQNMCLNKYNASLKIAIEGEDTFEKMKYICAVSCVFPSAKQYNVETSFLRINHHHVEEICPILENDSEQQACFKKYNITRSSSTSNDVNMERYECAIACISPVLFKWGRDDKDDKLCPLLEHKPEDDEKVIMCSNKYNSTTKYERYQNDAILHAKVFCTLSCISSNLLKAFVQIRNDTSLETIQATLDTRCPLLENTSENNKKERACLEKYKASKPDPFSFRHIDSDEQITMNTKYNCAVDCLFSEDSQPEAKNCSAYAH